MPEEPAAGPSQSALRFGWWGGGYSGSPTKIGIYQGLKPSPFWDFDTLQSNGQGTADFWGSQLNSESWDARSRFYQNGINGRVDFDQYIHQLPFTPITGGPRSSNDPVISENLNLGESSALRVQQLSTEFHGPLTQHISWKVRFFLMHKWGDRQAVTMAHCFNTNVGGGFPSDHCHVMSQQQHVDWLTLEVEPGLVANYDRLTLDYARTMRTFQANDQLSYAAYNHFPAFDGTGSTLTIYPSAIVPNSTFQMDRLKVGYDITDQLRFYSYVYNGLMTDDDSNTNTQIGGFDFRLVETLPNGITATAYAKMNEFHNELPPWLLPEEKSDPLALWHPINYNRLWTGLDGQWFPFRDVSKTWEGLSFRANYEYHEVARQYSYYQLGLTPNYTVPDTVTQKTITSPYFNQPSTRINKALFEARMRWTTGLVTFARYQFSTTENPLYGLTPNSGVLDSNLPTAEQMFELGGAWSPLSNLLLSVKADFQTDWLLSQYAHYAESNYPIICTLWYAPTQKLSLSAGYSYFSNWINQDVTMGFRGMDEPPPAETLRSKYTGKTQVFNIGARYAMSQKLIWNGGIFYTDGINEFNMPQASQTGANWATMPLYSNVLATSLRYQTGFDYNISPRLTAYFRANIFDYQDKSQGFYNGLSYFFLGGLTGTF